MHMGEIHLPGFDLYMVNDPELVDRVLTKEVASFPKSALLDDALRPLLGESIFTTNGAQWKRQRDMMNPAFAQTRLNVAFSAMQKAVDDMLARLAALPDGVEHDVEVEMTHVTADIIFRTIFSEPIQGVDAHRVFALFAEFQSLVPKLQLPAMYGMRWLAMPWHVWRSRKAAREIRRLLEKQIRPRFDANRHGQDSKHIDILEAFLNAKDTETGTPFDLKELVDQVAMLFLAGHETSASALTWSLHLLANSPDIQERMLDEVKTVIGDRSAEPTDIKKLELAQHVFRETLRLFPPVGFIARESVDPCTMRDKAVPAKACVMVAPWLIQRHRKMWAQPDAFDPDRYSREDSQAASRESLRDAYLPFGMGPRVCLGAAFALQEAVLILASLIRHYRLVPVPGHVPQPVGRLTIRSFNGVRLTLHRRR